METTRWIDHWFALRDGPFFVREGNPAVRRRGELVFIHGRLGQASMWEPVAGALASQFRCLSFDLPGHGRCAGLGHGHDIFQLAELVRQVLVQLLDGPAYLVGHDVGAALAEFCAVHWPELVSGLVLVNAACLSQPIRAIRRATPSIRAIQDSWPGPEERKVWKEAIRGIDKSMLLLWSRGDPLSPVERLHSLMTLRPDSDFCVREDSGRGPTAGHCDWVVAKVRDFLFRASESVPPLSVGRRSLWR